MKKRLFILFFVAVLLPSEIWAQRVMSDDILEKYESYQRPKSKFKFAKKQNIAVLKALKVLPIDTNAVYVSSSYQNAPYYRYTRFFSNGEVFVSHEYKNSPTEQECNDLSYGKWGMYSVKDDELIMEIYMRGFPSRYWYNYIKVEGDKLKYYKSIVGRWDKHTESTNFVEEKKQVNLTNFTINWK